MLDFAVQDSLCVGSVGGTEIKSSQPIESGKNRQLSKGKLKLASLRSSCVSLVIRIVIQKAIILYFFKCLFASIYFGTDGGNWG